MKFGRKYRLTIEMNDGGGAIVIEPPFTIQFSIERAANSNANSMSVLIYGLSETTRDKIRQDFFDFSYHIIKLEAGYDELNTVFMGNIQQASSTRQKENIVTIINALDGGFDIQNNQVNSTISGGISEAELLKELIGAFPNLTIGAIGNFNNKFNRAVVIEGNRWEQVKKYSKFQCFVDNLKVYALQTNEVVLLDGEIPVINSDNGLLESPRREGTFISVQMIFEPRISVGQIVALHSEVNKIYNGQYKVIGVSHQGVISEATGGTCISRFDLFAGTKGFTQLVPADPIKPAQPI